MTEIPYNQKIIYDFRYDDSKYFFHPYTVQHQKCLLLAENMDSIESKVKTIIDGVLFPLFHQPPSHIHNKLHSDSNFFWMSLLMARCNSFGSTNTIQAFPCPVCKSRGNVVIMEMVPKVVGESDSFQMETNETNVSFKINVKRHFQIADVSPDTIDKNAASANVSAMVDIISANIGNWDTAEENKKFILEKFSAESLNELVDLYMKRKRFSTEVRFFGEDGQQPAKCNGCGTCFKSEESSSAKTLMKLVNQGENLSNYFETSFHLMKVHGFSLHEVEAMLPYERELYLLLLQKHERKMADLQAKEEQKYAK